VSKPVPCVVTNRSLATGRSSVNRASGASPPPHEPALADVPAVVPVKRPPGRVTNVAATSHAAQARSEAG